MSERSEILLFETFALDPAERRLTRDGRLLDLQGRYFDALLLLAGDAGKLVSKDRFFAEVWNGVPVTDEALTQCIRTIRRTLGDKSSSPRFIETVPRHGYRFIAPVESAAAPAAGPSGQASPPRDTLARLLATLLGGGVAGTVGGMIYGFLIASQPASASAGSASLLILILGLSITAAVLGAAGVAAGMAGAAALAGRDSPWTVAGAALGGLVVGALTKMIWLDSFRLVVGRVPGEPAGAAEGFILGAGVGLGAWLATRLGGFERPAHALGAAAASGGAAGVLVSLLGLRLMAGSLESFARSSAGARWDLAPVARMFGEPSFGAVAALGTAALEGALYAGCIAAALLIVRDRSWRA